MSLSLLYIFQLVSCPAHFENERETSLDQWVRFEIAFTNSIVYTPTPWLTLLLVLVKSRVTQKLH